MCIGKTDRSFWSDAVLEYQKRLKHYVRFSIIYLPEIKILKKIDKIKVKIQEGKLLLQKLNPNDTVILLDEPFAGVDPISISDIKDIISHLKARDIGVLITDHNVRETLDICERAYIVGEGHVIASGTPAEVLANDKVRETYLGEHFSL